MKTIIMFFAVVLAAGCASNGGPQRNGRVRGQAAQDGADLAAALGGRIAGPSQDCVDEREVGSSKSYGRDAVVFAGRTDDVVYVNRPAVGCPGLDFGLALKIRIPSARLCRGDIVTVFDPVSGVEYGACSLGEFTPYRRVR